SGTKKPDNSIGVPSFWMTVSPIHEDSSMRHLHYLTLGLLALVAVAVALPTRLAAGEAAKELLKVTDKLTNDDPADKLVTRSKCKVHTFKMEAGKGYKIDMQSTDFDTFLRLENPDGKQVAYNDDVAPGNLNSQIIYLAPTTGEYRIIATAFDGKIGQYTL